MYFRPGNNAHIELTTQGIQRFYYILFPTHYVHMSQSLND